MSVVRVLVVDDFEPWRRKVCELLGGEPDLLVVSLAGDGLEAVQQAKALQPDLIILDVALPLLNGIESARQIQELSPKSKILFFSLNANPEFVEAALATGAHGYLVKTCALQELVMAVRAVSAGKQFVSLGLALSDRHSLCPKNGPSSK